MSTVVTEHNIKLEVESGAPFDVRDLTAYETLNAPFVVEMMVRSPKHDLDLSQIVGRPAAARVTMVDSLHRVWSGVVAHIEHAHWDLSTTGQSTYFITLVDNMWLLQYRRGTRIFQHMKPPHIIDAILKEWKIEAEWKIDIGQYKEKEYCVQYGESDFDFVNRLLEESGISYYFINKGAGGGKIQSQVVFNDKPQSSARTVTLPWADNPNETGGTGFFTGVSLAHKHKPGLFSLGDYNFRKPKKPLFASSEKAPGIEGSREIYDFLPGQFLIETGGPGGGPSDEKVADNKSTTTHDWEDYGKKLAQRYLEAERNDKRLVSYQTSNQALRAGGVCGIDPHPHPELDNKDLLVVSSRCVVDATGEWTVVGTAVFADSPYRPSRMTKKPTIHGVQPAIVTGPKGEEIYTDEFGRVRVRFLWDREGDFDDKATCWLRVSQMWGGAQYGVVNLPRIGHEVIVDFLDGDPDQPVIVGRLHTVPAPNPYILPKHKTRSTWQTNTTPAPASGKDFNERMFEDKKDEELVFIQAQRNYMSLTKRHETERTGEDRLAVIGKHHLSVVREIDQRHASDQHIVRMVEPTNLKILEMEDPQFTNKDTFINMEKGMMGDSIVVTTGGAKIELSGDDIKISADRGIRFSAEKNLIIKGSMHMLNFMPAFVMPSRASTAIDDKIKKPEDDVKNAIEQLFSKDKKPETKAQTKVRKIKGAVDVTAAVSWADSLAKTPPKDKPEKLKVDPKKNAEEKSAYDERQRQIAEANAKVQAGELTHPNATKEQLKNAYEGDETGTRIPLSFKSKEQYQRFQKDLKAVFDKHGIDDATVQQVGSATSGYRGNPTKPFGPWKPESDNDFAVFSPKALAQAQQNNTPVNQKIVQGGRFTVFKNSASGGRGFYKTPLGKDLQGLSKKWNKEIYGHEGGALQPKKEGQKRATRDGFDFKLNTSTEPFKTKPKGGAVTTMGPGK
jgi:type VI secretion system secreted protein VgrG